MQGLQKMARDMMGGGGMPNMPGMPGGGGMPDMAQMEKMMKGMFGGKMPF